MIDELRAHIEELFSEAPQTKQVVEIKEEILQNTIDRYNDLIAEGKTEQAAFNIAIAGVGDIDKLIKDIPAVNSAATLTNEQIARERRRSALLLAVAIMLYILCVIPPILTENTVGVVLMFVIVAIATGIIIYRANTSLSYVKNDDTVVENFKEWNHKRDENKSLKKSINSAVGALTLILYFVISFFTGAWAITWLIFFVGAAANNIINACFDLKG